MAARMPTHRETALCRGSLATGGVFYGMPKDVEKAVVKNIVLELLP